MAFPKTVELDWGMEKLERATQISNIAIGTRGILPDGRVFRYSKLSTTAVAAGKLCQTPVTAANHDMDLAVQTAAAIGDKQIKVTLGATAAAVNLYKGGYIWINDGPGEGHFYRIKSHAAVASAGTLTAVLEDGETVRVALTTADSLAGLKLNPYSAVIVMPTTVTGIPLGVTPIDITASYYFWLQTWGDCAVLINGTVVLGRAVAAGGTTAGSLDTYPITLASATPDTYATGDTPVVGVVQNPIAVTTDYGHIFLMIAP